MNHKYKASSPSAKDDDAAKTPANINSLVFSSGILPQSLEKFNHPLFPIIPLGRENAITSKDVRRIAGYKHVRDVTSKVSDLRKAGYLICNAVKNPMGYFRPEHMHDVREFVNQMDSRRREINASTRSARKALISITGSDSQIQMDDIEVNADAEESGREE